MVGSGTEPHAGPLWGPACRLQQGQRAGGGGAPRCVCLAPHCPAPHAGSGLAATTRVVLAVSPGAALGTQVYHWVSVTKMIEMLTVSGKERPLEEREMTPCIIALGRLGLLHPNAY